VRWWKKPKRAAPATPPPPPDAGPFHDPAALMRIQQLEFRARVVVEGLWHGLHRSPRHGFSTEFTEYRPYAAGDDLRYLDWRVFARSDRHYLRKFEDETNLGCHFLLDVSGSMAYGSLGFRKLDYAATLVATLGLFLHAQGDAVGLLAFDSALRAYVPASRRRGQFQQILAETSRAIDGGGTALAASLERLPELLRRRSALVVVSDLLSPVEELERRLAEWLACGHEASVFQVLDPTELTFAFDDPAEFVDLESGKGQLLEPDAVREGYLAKLQAHLEAVETLCSRLGAHYHRFAVDRPLELALFDYLADRERLGPRRVMGGNR